jgi:ubiquinone/menaquinone biosynthesis C-methylase UbiE
LDISEEEIKFAQSQLEAAGLQAEQLVVGDARRLREFVSGS